MGQHINCGHSYEWRGRPHKGKTTLQSILVSGGLSHREVSEAAQLCEHSVSGTCRGQISLKWENTIAIVDALAKLRPGKRLDSRYLQSIIGRQVGKKAGDRAFLGDAIREAKDYSAILRFTHIGRAAGVNSRLFPSWRGYVSPKTAIAVRVGNAFKELSGDAAEAFFWELATGYEIFDTIEKPLIPDEISGFYWREEA